jgi:hypothetical protein
MDLLLIVGGGKFGEKALNYAKKKKYRAVIIDKDPNCLCSQYAIRLYKNIEQLKEDLMKSKKEDLFFLNKNIVSTFDVIKTIDLEYIIPVVPEHLMAHLIKKFLQNHSINLKIDLDAYERFLSQVNQGLLISKSKEQGLVCLSYAQRGEICPNNCIGPEDYCPNFQREKPITITNYLKSIYNVKNSLKIIRNEDLFFYNINESIQLKSGLGGLKGENIQRILNKLEKHKKNFLDQNSYFVITTSCNCHGVINFLKSAE